MTNYEKYRDLVISCILQDSVCDLAYKAHGYKSCDKITCKECCEFTAEWINRKYIGIDWAKVPVDTPVIITTKDGFILRHFAKSYRGNVYVYANGQTSWTNAGETEPWEPEYVEFRRDEDAIKYAK